MKTPRTVTLPLDQVIAVYPGFWFCILCAHPGKPGLGRHWTQAAQANAETAAIKHLQEHHGLIDVAGETE